MSLVGLSHELGGATPFSALGVDMAPFGFAHFDRASSRRYEEQKCKPADRLALTQQMGPIAWNIIVGHRREIAPLLGFAGKRADLFARCRVGAPSLRRRVIQHHRSEEHTSELQSLMRISYAVFCLKKKK